MSRRMREIERVRFSADDLTEVVSYMVQVTLAGDGWINLVPNIADFDERPTSLGFLTMVGGGGTRMTMCTWIPGNHDRRRHTWTSLGITHLIGHRAIAELYSLSVPVPQTWIVEQDHPRRGLVFRVPSDEAHEMVLGWALRAVSALSTPTPIRTWRADVYLPAAT